MKERMVRQTDISTIAVKHLHSLLS